MKFSIRDLLLVIVALPLFLATSTPALLGGEITAELTHGEPITDREKAWAGHIRHASWLSEKQVVFWSSKGELVCLSLDAKSPIWTLKTVANVSNWSVSRKSQLIAFAASGQRFGENSVAVIDAKTGKAVFEANGDKLAKLVKQDYVVVSTVGLTPGGERLVLINSSGKFERSGFAFDPRKPDKVTSFRVDPSIRELSFSPDGKRIAYIAEGDHDGQREAQILAVRTIDADQDVFVQGKRVLETPEFQFFSTDVPSFSHIRHDGQNLLLIAKDNAWNNKGEIFLRDLATGKVRSFDIGRGHIVLDVRFDLKRIALTGTSTDVTVIDFDGKVVAEQKHGTADRNVSIEFSPAGDRLLVGSWDNTVRVFRITE